MDKASKRSAWVAFAGFLSMVLTLFIQNIGDFNLSREVEMAIMIVATSLIATITKELNNASKNKVQSK